MKLNCPPIFSGLELRLERLGIWSNIAAASHRSVKNEEIDMRRAIAGVAIIVTMCSVSIAAQWPKHPTPGVPRDAEGRVRLDAPTPRMTDGKPDLSGNWIRFRGEGAFAAPELSGLVRNQAAATRRLTRDHLRFASTSRSRRTRKS